MDFILNPIAAKAITEFRKDNLPYKRKNIATVL